MEHLAFISYSHEDKAAADTVCAGLEAHGVACWIAPRDVEAGTDYPTAIMGAIRMCRVMVVLFSANSNKSRHVLKEVERAVRYDIPVVPLRIAEVALSDAMEYFLSTPHWFDAFEADLEQYMQPLAATVGHICETRSAKPGPGAISVEPDPTPSQSSQNLAAVASGFDRAAGALELSEESLQLAQERMKREAERIYAVLDSSGQGEHRLTYAQLAEKLLAGPASDDEIHAVKRLVSSLVRDGLLPGVSAHADGVNLVSEYFPFRTRLRGDEKKRIARHCLSFIEDGCAVILDAGSTTLLIAAGLADEIREGRLSDLAVICFSPAHVEPILVAANDRGMIDEQSRFQVYSPGGRVRLSTQAIVVSDPDPHGKDLLDAYVRGLEREVVCFVGASGITAAEGFTTRTAVEATNKQTILDLGARRFIVADAAKIGNAWSTRFADVGPGVTLVTNDESASDPSFLQATEAIKDAGCEIVLC